MPATAWLTRLVATSESAPFAEVTLVALGGSRRRQAARSTAVLVIAVALACVAMLWGRVADPAPYPAATAIALLGMHLAEACAGAGIGVLIAPPLRTRVGTAVVAVTGLTVVSLAVPWLPPLNPVLQAAFHHRAPGCRCCCWSPGRPPRWDWPVPWWAPRWPGPGGPADRRFPGGIAVMAHWLPK